MVACVNDPVDGWGGGQAPLHQMKSACSRHHHREHVGQKRRTYVHDQVGGWGGRRKIYPRPLPSEVIFTLFIIELHSAIRGVKKLQTSFCCRTSTHRNGFILTVLK
jgi:hypothetical protein